MSGWPNLSDLLVGMETTAPVGLVGAPLAAGSVTSGQCDLAPPLLRETLRRIGRYDVETGRELETRVADRGDIDLLGLRIEDATPRIRDAIAAGRLKPDNDPQRGRLSSPPSSLVRLESPPH